MKQNAVISEMTNEELSDAIAEQYAKYNQIRIQHQVSPLDNTNQLKNSRRLVARLKTEENKRKAQAKQG